jgi:hypothetical protein
VNEPRAASRSAAAAWVAVLAGLDGLAVVATLPLSLLSGQLGNGVVAVVIGIPCTARWRWLRLVLSPLTP